MCCFDFTKLLYTYTCLPLFKNFRPAAVPACPPACARTDTRPGECLSRPTFCLKGPARTLSLRGKTEPLPLPLPLPLSVFLVSFSSTRRAVPPVPGQGRTGQARPIVGPHLPHSLPPRPHNSTGAGQAACSPPRPANSPEQRQWRPKIHAATVLHRRSTSRRPERQKSNPRRAYTTPPPFPGQVRPPPRRIPAIFIPVRGLDHIARSEVFLGAGTQNPGTCS
jgi:hypothetical protein